MGSDHRNIAFKAALPPSITAVTIAAARRTPTKIARKAFLRSMSNTKAAMAPVQAPVMGKGIPTKINGKKVNSLEAFLMSNKIGGRNGIGIGIHVVENRFALC